MYVSHAHALAVKSYLRHLRRDGGHTWHDPQLSAGVPFHMELRPSGVRRKLEAGGSAFVSGGFTHTGDIGATVTGPWVAAGANAFLAIA